MITTTSVFSTTHRRTGWFGGQDGSVLDGILNSIVIYTPSHETKYNTDLNMNYGTNTKMVKNNCIRFQFRA